MKYIASNVNCRQDVEIDNIPIITYDELAIPTPNGNIVFVAGAYSWNRLLTNTDMTSFIGQWFNLESTEWKIDNCILCIDGTIFLEMR